MPDAERFSEVFPKGRIKPIAVDYWLCPFSYNHVRHRRSYELAHMEMIAGLVYKLTDGASPEDFKAAGWEGQWVQHDHALFWTDVNGVPWTAKYIAALGDPITDLVEDMAAEQKARTTYEHLIAGTDDELAKATLRWLWEREVVHFQRFGEALNDVQEWMANSKHVWCGCDGENKKKIAIE